MGLSHIPPKRGGKTRSWTGFHFTVLKRPVPGSVPGSSGPSLAKRPHLDSGNEAHPSGKKSAGGNVSTSSADPRRKGVCGSWCSYVPWSSATSSNSSAAFQVGRLFRFFDQWRGITSNRFVHNMVRGHHLQLWSHPPLFHNFWQFNVKVATTHHPIIQNEMDELLAKGAFVPSSGGDGFYFNIFVVPQHTGRLQPILNWKHFICYMHVPSFKMPTIIHVLQLIQHGDYAFSIELQGAYLHIPVVKHHCHFL